MAQSDRKINACDWFYFLNQSFIRPKKPERTFFQVFLLKSSLLKTLNLNLPKSKQVMRGQGN
jgi:hypothetical protein